jgi:4-amino-4-deoxy-L-arabinose transferase-like glycosyltransferase
LGLAALVIGFGMIVCAAWLASASLRLRDAADFLLAVYLFSTAGVILIVLLLSPFALVTRGGVLVASAGAVAAAVATWHSRGRPATPSMRVAVSAAWAALRDPLLTLLAVAVALGLAYAATLAIATPANEFDVLWYHLPRAALWTQEHGVHYIEHANTTRLNENPPGAEILSAWAMTLEGSDRFASIFQVVALAATLLAITRIARLLGFSDREAAFGALLFATLPVVALQAATALNDIVMTSFVVAVVAFMLSDTGAALGVGGLALALSVATKGTAAFTVPMLLVIAAILVPRRRWLSVGVAGAVSIAVGAVWYVFHYFEAGGVAGDEQEAILNRGSEPWRIPAYMARLAIDAVDPAGSAGPDRYAYAVAAGLLLVLAGVSAYRARSRAAALARVGAAALVLLPVAFESIHNNLRRGYQHALVGHSEDLAFLGLSREPTIPQPSTSWYGPVGLIAFLIAVAVLVLTNRRGSVRRGTPVLALAPLVMLVIVTATWTYSPWHGRFFMPAVALSTATWGVLHRVRALGWALSAIAVVTLLLSFLHYLGKPAGISLLDGTTSRSVWTASRETVVFMWPRKPSGERLAVRRLGSRMKDGETVALRIGGGNLSYRYFDAGLERRVVFVDDKGGLDDDADWLVMAPGLAVDICPSGWRREMAAHGWRVYRRVGLCPGESAAS